MQNLHIFVTHNKTWQVCCKTKKSDPKRTWGRTSISKNSVVPSSSLRTGFYLHCFTGGLLGSGVFIGLSEQYKLTSTARPVFYIYRGNVYKICILVIRMIYVIDYD